MYQVMDHYRTQYEKETNKAVCAEEIEESLIPKWEYVVWLEDKLYNATQPRQGEGGNSSPSGPPTQVKTPAAPTPEGEICRCESGSGWREQSVLFPLNTFKYCPSCGKLLLT